MVQELELGKIRLGKLYGECRVNLLEILPALAALRHRFLFCISSRPGHERRVPVSSSPGHRCKLEGWGELPLGSACRRVTSGELLGQNRCTYRAADRRSMGVQVATKSFI